MEALLRDFPEDGTHVEKNAKGERVYLKNLTQTPSLANVCSSALDLDNAYARNVVATELEPDASSSQIRVVKVSKAAKEAARRSRHTVTLNKANKEANKAQNSRLARNFYKDQLMDARSMSNSSSSAAFNMVARAFCAGKGVNPTPAGLIAMAPPPPPIAPPLEPDYVVISKDEPIVVDGDDVGFIILSIVSVCRCASEGREKSLLLRLFCILVRRSGFFSLAKNSRRRKSPQNRVDGQIM